MKSASGTSFHINSLAKAPAEKQLEPTVASGLLTAGLLSSSPCDRKPQKGFAAWICSVWDLRPWFSTHRGLPTPAPGVLHPKAAQQN